MRIQYDLIGVIVLLLIDSSAELTPTKKSNRRNSKMSNIVVDDKMEAAAAHNDATIALAKKESAEHMEGMAELYQTMRQRPLIIKAYAVDDDSAPVDAMTVHFVRHGQGFHNLMADLANAAGREWKQVRALLLI